MEKSKLLKLKEIYLHVGIITLFIFKTKSNINICQMLIVIFAILCVGYKLFKVMKND